MTLRRRRIATGCCVSAVAAAVLVIGETMVVRAYGRDARSSRESIRARAVGLEEEGRDKNGRRHVVRDRRRDCIRRR